MKKLLIILFIALAINSYCQVFGSKDRQGYSYSDLDASLYMSSLTTPITDSMSNKIFNFIIKLKDSLNITNLYQRFDVFYLFANETSELALRNMAKRSFDGTIQGTVTFTVYEGFTGNGSTGIIKTGYIPSVSAYAFELYYSSLGIYSRTNILRNNVDIGCYSTTPVSYSALGVRLSASNFTATINRNTNVGSNYYPEDSTGIGMFVVTNPNTPSTNNLYINGLYVATNSTTIFTYNLSSLEFYVLAYNNNGSVGLPSTNQISVAFIGGGLSDEEVEKITNCIEWYMDSNGKGVID